MCVCATQFAEGRALGKTGMRWLKIHLANLYGKDKLSLDEREVWTSENLTQVLEAANNPLKGERDAWWTRAEDPWQCLAVCFEIRDALASGNPETFVSRLPVHQDGSCNGLQHYAALGRDDWGGRAVNLFPADRPQDIYSGVLHHVIAKVEQVTRLTSSLLSLSSPPSLDLCLTVRFGD
jgi:DNA-directed RNA polymerase